jgi:hypothetical protein
MDVPTAILPETSKKQGTRPRSGRNAPAGGDPLRVPGSKAQCCQAALQAAAERARCVEEQLAQREARIAELEAEISKLNEKIGDLEKDNDAYVTQAEDAAEIEYDRDAAAQYFATLIAALDDYFAIRFLPIHLRFAIETAADCLGVVRRW